jgi:hypothetical protein
MGRKRSLAKHYFDAIAKEKGTFHSVRLRPVAVGRLSIP